MQNRQAAATDSFHKLQRPEKSSDRIPELDGLRGVAILSVLLWHYYYFHPAADHRPTGAARQLYVHLERFLGLGWSGVDLFFVLSGFLIGGILLKVRNSPNYYKTFYLRRFFRIIPIYYLWTLAYLLAWVLLTILRSDTTVLGPPGQWLVVLGNFVFIQNLGLGYAGWAGPWLMPTWSLAVEEQFYLVSPFIIRKFGARFLAWFLCAVVIAAPLLRLWMRFRFGVAGIHLAYELMPCRADSLAVGMLIALFWRDQSWRNRLRVHFRLLACFVALLFVGYAFLAWFFPNPYLLPTQVFGHTWLAFFYGAVLTMALLSPHGWLGTLLRAKMLRNWGRISYCVYLIQQMMNVFAHWLLRASDGNTNWRTLAAPTLAILLTYVLATLSWKFLEEKMLRFGAAFKY